MEFSPNKTPTATEIVVAIMEREQRYAALENLCGSMIATLAISRNRDRMRDGDGEAIESLIAISDRWAKEFDKISGRATPDPIETARLASAKITAHDFLRIARALDLPDEQRTTIDEMVERIDQLKASSGP